MTEALLALVPTYGLWLIFAAVLLACFGLPMPAPIIVLTAGPSRLLKTSRFGRFWV